MLVHKYMDENSSAAMLVNKRSAGVTAEVNLRIPLHISNKAHKRWDPPWLGNTRQMSKLGYQ